MEKSLIYRCALYVAAGAGVVEDAPTSRELVTVAPQPTHTTSASDMGTIDFRTVIGPQGRN